MEKISSLQQNDLFALIAVALCVYYSYLSWINPDKYLKHWSEDERGQSRKEFFESDVWLWVSRYLFPCMAVLMSIFILLS